MCADRLNCVAQNLPSIFDFSLLLQVSFVIPVFNQLAHTQACRNSLEAHLPAALNYEVIWVDDGSDEETKHFLGELSHPHRVVTLLENSGFAEATNVGAYSATGKWLCLLNNDVEITPGAIEELIAVAEAHVDAGIVGNVQITTKGEEVDHAGIKFIDGGYPVHHQESLRELAKGPNSRAVLAVTAACCLVNRAWFHVVDGLDTRYRNGFEDVDLCLRAREAGWKIYVARNSVVKHAVSTSRGRGSYEYRNAQKFLERWESRAAALQQSEAIESARGYRLKRARSTKAVPDAVRRTHAAILRREDERRIEWDHPAIVWVDLLRMEPRGANGGIKPLVYGFLEEMTLLAWQPLRFVILAQTGLLEEMSFLRSSDIVASREGASWLVKGMSAVSQKISQTELEASFPAEVLYSPFGASAFARENLPMIALLVDSLHRDLSAALPVEEVNFREDSFKRTLGSKAWIQTLARHGIDRLHHHFGIHPTRCFHTYASVQNRLEHESPEPSRPPSLPDGKFFFYPANFWPHKNHEVLLTAYRQYFQAAGDGAWPMLLTGHPDERMAALQELSKALGLESLVTFAGYLPDDAFKSVWHHAGALVFPSLHEGFGIPLVEAFQTGLPVLAARASVLPEVGRGACEWFDPRDPQDVAAALTRVADDEELRANLVAKGTAQLSRFSRHYEASKLNHFLYAAARNLVP